MIQGGYHKTFFAQIENEETQAAALDFFSSDFVKSIVSCYKAGFRNRIFSPDRCASSICSSSSQW